MRILVIPDIHLKSWIFDRAEEIIRSGKADRAVCLMDIPDDWDMELDIVRYRDTFQLIRSMRKMDLSQRMYFLLIETDGKSVNLRW